jgi:uncharacterized protein (DUF4415 family)
LDFRDAVQIFDGRPFLHMRSFRNNEERTVSIADIEGEFYTVVWTWRGESRRIISFRSARDAEERRYRAVHGCTAGGPPQSRRNRGETRSNWANAAALTNEEIEAQIAADPDEAGMVIDWASATVEMPQPKAVLNMRIDRDVLEYFPKMGKGYQTRINAVLRSYMDRMRHHE